MVFNAQGQPSGEAFIQMDGEGSAFGAANHRHHRYMVFGKKQRYIEVFQCSGEDMSLVLTGGAAATGGQTKPPLLSPGGSLIHGGASYPFSPLLQGARHPAPGSFPPYPPHLLYWPYPSPPMSPNNYFLPSHPSTLLTPTSSMSSISSLSTLSNGVTSPPPPPLQASPAPCMQTQPPNALLTVETTHLQRGATERSNTESLLRSSVYIH